MERREHWDQVYTTRAVDQVGWYKPHLETSLGWIRRLDLAPADPILDVGGGASTLVDDLLRAGHTALTILDISAAALATARQRLGPRAAAVSWCVADITSTELPVAEFRLWHDRAVFHFLVAAADRRSYRRRLSNALAPGGHVIIGTFTPEAPPRCSGLPVQRYDVSTLMDELGSGLELERHQFEVHVTPGGVEQHYLFCQLRKVS